MNAINKEMIRLFEERLNIVVEIAKYKEEHQMQIHDVEREQEILEAAAASVDKS